MPARSDGVRVEVLAGRSVLLPVLALAGRDCGREGAADTDAPDWCHSLLYTHSAAVSDGG